MLWKRLSVFFVLSLLVLSSVAAAWLPFFPSREPEDLSGLTALVEEKEAEILSQEEYIASLESQLETLSQDSMKLVSKAESLQTQVTFWQKKASDLQSSLEVLNAKAHTSSSLSELAETDSVQKDQEIQNLVEKTDRTFAPFIGAGATWDPSSGNLGATADFGIRLNRLSLLAGLEYSPSSWTLALPSMEDLSFSTGLQVEF